MPASTIQLLESGLFPDRQSPKDVPNLHPETQDASRIVAPAGKFACTGSRACVGIQDITFLHVEGQRDAVCEPEYLCVGKMGLRHGADLPYNHLRVYRREVARKDS